MSTEVEMEDVIGDWEVNDVGEIDTSGALTFTSKQGEEEEEEEVEENYGEDSAVPPTPTKTGGSLGEDLDADLITPRLDAIDERSVSFDVSVNGSDAMDEDMNADSGDNLEEKTDDPLVGRRIL
ncbi:hypothetical protein GQ600_22561 [Phytophthora cactorum]|nr:hypothetical protein GQ600_22561 [Phytophthora cactorum]